MEMVRDPRELKFLYCTCSLKPFVLSYWITQVPEFYDELMKAKLTGVLINDYFLLDVIQRIYNDKLAYIKETGERIDFRFSLARHTINQLNRLIESGCAKV